MGATVIYGGHDLESQRARSNSSSTGDRPTAIFALTNVCALASIKAAHAGLEIPGDVSMPASTISTGCRRSVPI